MATLVERAIARLVGSRHADCDGPLSHRFGAGRPGPLIVQNPRFLAVATNTLKRAHRFNL